MRATRALLAGMLLVAYAPATVADDSALFPSPLAGWTAGKVQVKETKEDPLSGPVDEATAARSDPLGLLLTTRRQLTREYTAPDGKAGLAVLIDSYDCIGALLIEQLHKDPAMRAKSTVAIRPIRVRDHDAMESYGRGGAREIVAIRLSICGVVTIGGPKVPAGALDAYVNRLDLKRIEAAVQ